MKQQPVPAITSGDVVRLIARDFPDDLNSEVVQILEQYKGPEKNRVSVAALKLSAGNLVALRTVMQMAQYDYRDVVAPAEYPEYDKKGSESTSDSHRQQIIENDWQQYIKWLKK